MFRVLTILLFSVFITSCSTRIFYNYADWWVEWQIEDLVDLNDQQETKVIHEIDRFFIWHRTNELPKYAQLLNQIKQVIKEKNTEGINQISSQLIDIWQRSADKFIPPLIEVINTLDTKQKHQLVENINIKQQEQHNNWYKNLNDEKKIQERLKDRLETFNDWFGYLTKHQELSYKTMTAQMKSTMEDRILARERWLVVFEQALFQQPIDSNKFKMLIGDINHQRTEEHIAKVTFNKNLYQGWLSSQLLMLEDKQILSAVEEINSYLKDIDYLIGQQK